MTKLLSIVLTVLSVSILLSSCSNSNKGKNNDAAKDTTTISNKNQSADSSSNTNYLKMEGDSVIIPPFEIEVSLSPKAIEKITRHKETIIVSASFSGTPKDSTSKDIAEDGGFYLNSAQKEITYGQIARFGNLKFPKRLYDQLADKDIDLLINVFTGRRSSKDNLINCDILADKMSKIQNKRFILKGKLIYGDD